MLHSLCGRDINVLGMLVLHLQSRKKELRIPQGGHASNTHVQRHVVQASSDSYFRVVQSEVFDVYDHVEALQRHVRTCTQQPILFLVQRYSACVCVCPRICVHCLWGYMYFELAFRLSICPQ